jgi:hypothetical protein
LNDTETLAAGSGPRRPDSSNQFHVYISDNFHMHDPDEHPYLHSSYPTLEAAIAFCKRRIDEDLEGLRNPREATSTRPQDAAELYSMYCMFGEDPWISGPGSGSILFSGWGYAKQRCSELSVQAPLDGTFVRSVEQRVSMRSLSKRERVLWGIYISLVVGLLAAVVIGMAVRS